MIDERMNLTDVEYFEKMLLAKALKRTEERSKLKLLEHHFENEKHGAIYTKLANDMTVEPETLLTEGIRNPKKFGDYEFIKTIVNFPVPTLEGIVNDQLQIYDFYKKRVLKQKIAEYTEYPTSEKSIELSRTIEDLESFNLENKNHKIETITEIVDDLYGVNDLSVIQTGYNDLDNIITGFEPQQLNVVAARPSMGEYLPLTSVMV